MVAAQADLRRPGGDILQLLRGRQVRDLQPKKKNSTQYKGGWGRNVLEQRIGGEGGANVRVPKMAQSDFPNGKFRFFPRWSLWSWGGGGGGSSYGARPF